MGQRLALISLVLALAGPALAQSAPHAPRDRVLDQAGALSSAHRDELQREIWGLELATQAEIGVLVGRTSGRLGAQEYARRVFEAWRIGKAGRDNGVLLLLLVSDREVRILPGRGYKDLFDEEAAGRILDEEVVPCLKRGDHGAAVVAGVRRIAAEVRRREGAPEAGPGPVEAPMNGFGGSTASAPHHTTSPTTPVRHDVEAGGRTRDTPVIPTQSTLPRPTPTVHYAQHQGFVQRTLHNVGGFFFWIVIFVVVVGLAILFRPKCPRCRTYLSTSSRTLVSATYFSSGRGERTLDCPRCHYHRVEVYTIPTKTRSSSHRSSFGGSSFGGSSGRSSGGGSSSFGGGRSSGGGAGRSW